jgi:predicted nucleic acid-binding protein
MIFVDTGAWAAQVWHRDGNHAAAMDWLAQNRQPLVTTDYIVDEVLTLLTRRA